MANATATLTLNPHPYDKDETLRRELLYGTCALSASGTYQTNGVPLTWTFTSATGGQALFLSTQTQPSEACFYSVLGGGYNYVFDKTHDTLRIFNGITELTNGAAITADTIGFRAEYARGY